MSILISPNVFLSKHVIYLHEEAATFPGNVDHLSNVLRVHSQWLFTQDMLLSLQKQFRKRKMQGGDWAYVDDICRLIMMANHNYFCLAIRIFMKEGGGGGRTGGPDAGKGNVFVLLSACQLSGAPAPLHAWIIPRCPMYVIYICNLISKRHTHDDNNLQ